jgi:hypothetical protein
VEGAEAAGRDRLLKIGILQHNQCGVAAQLQVHPLEQSSREQPHGAAQ